MFKFNDLVEIKVGYPDDDVVYMMHIIDQYTLDNANTLLEDVHATGCDYVVKINGNQQLHD